MFPSPSAVHLHLSHHLTISSVKSSLKRLVAKNFLFEQSSKTKEGHAKMLMNYWTRFCFVPEAGIQISLGWVNDQSGAGRLVARNLQDAAQLRSAKQHTHTHTHKHTRFFDELVATLSEVEALASIEFSFSVEIFLRKKNFQFPSGVFFLCPKLTMTRRLHVAEPLVVCLRNTCGVWWRFDTPQVAVAGSNSSVVCFYTYYQRLGYTFICSHSGKTKLFVLNLEFFKSWIEISQKISNYWGSWSRSFFFVIFQKITKKVVFPKFPKNVNKFFPKKRTKVIEVFQLFGVKFSSFYFSSEVKYYVYTSGKILLGHLFLWSAHCGNAKKLWFHWCWNRVSSKTQDYFPSSRYQEKT